MYYDRVFIFLTPFHKTVAETCFPTKLKEHNSLVVFANNIVDYKTGVPIERCNTKIVNVFKSPLSTYLEYRRYIKYSQKLSLSILKRLQTKSKIEIIIGSEKDLFTQVFLQQVFKKRKANLIFFEDGMGFYYRPPKFRLSTILYPLITPILFGCRINKVYVFGKDKRASKVYCRYPEHITKSTNVEYVKFKMKSEAYNPPKKSNKAIVFTTPPQDFQLSEKNSITLIKKIANEILNSFEKIEIKPHPRDLSNYNKLASDNIKIIKKNKSAEKLNFNEFSTVIHFNSTLIIHLLEINFPKDKIISIITPKSKNTFTSGSKEYFIKMEKKHFDKIVKFISKQTLSSTLHTNNKDDK